MAGLDIVPLTEDRIMLRSFSSTIVLSGQFVARSLPLLLPCLDGNHDLDDLKAFVDPDYHPELDALLRQLEEKGFLTTGRREATSPIRNGREQAYWAVQTASTADVARRLAKASVIVAGLGGVGATVATALAAAGVGQLTLVDPCIVAEMDVGFGFGTNEVGEARAVALAARLGDSAVRAEGLNIGIDAVSDWSALVAGAGHVVLCSDTMALAGHDRTNAACLAARTPWLSVRADRGSALIGPYVIPGESACFTCFELRNRINSDHPADHEAMTAHWKSIAPTAEPWPALGAFTAAVGQMVALDLIHVIGGARLSAALGRVIHLSPAVFNARHHEVLKLPRCPACSRLRERPMTRIWDIVASPSVDSPALAASE